MILNKKDIHLLTSNRFHLDEFILNSFCIHTIKACNSKFNKFVMFKNLLHSFHSEFPEIYEDNIFNYMGFISYSILIEVFNKNKNIKEFETYFYNTVKGYASVHQVQITERSIAKVWIQLNEVYVKVIDVVSNPLIKEIKVDETLFTSFKHINTFGIKDVNNYYFNVHLTLVFEDKHIEVIQILPSNDSLNLFNNIFTSTCSRYYKNRLTKIHTIDIYISKDVHVSYYELVINDTRLKAFNRFQDSLYIDFNKVNISNCSNCALNCQYSDIYKTRYASVPWKKNRRSIESFEI